MPNIKDFVGRVAVDQMPELLDEAWSAATTDQQAEFLSTHRGELGTHGWNDEATWDHLKKEGD